MKVLRSHSPRTSGETTRLADLSRSGRLLAAPCPVHVRLLFLLLLLPMACQPSSQQEHPASPTGLDQVPQPAPEAPGPARPASLSAAQERDLLTRVADVRALTAEEAGGAFPVRLRGTATYYDAVWRLLFIQDATAGIYVDTQAPGILSVKPGQLIEVEGFSGPGDFAPIVVASRVQILASSTMPAEPHRSLEKMFSGQEDSQWVEAEGIVRSVAEVEEHAVLEIASGVHRLSAFIPGFGDRPPPEHLVDARVRIRGVCGTIFNQKRQLIGIRLFVPDLKYVSVQEVPSRADPFSLPPRPVNSLMQFTPGEAVGHRVRLQGVVTLQRPSGDLFIQDETGGIYVQARHPVPVRPGDRVDVVGFAASGEFTPVLQDATFRRAGAGPLPTPVPVTADQALEGGYDAQLVQLEAYLLDQVRGPNGQVLTLQAGDLIFPAHLEQGSYGNRLRNGSLLQLTGISSTQQVDQGRAYATPASFRFFLRSAEDIVVLKQAPWWTLAHTLGLVGLMAGVAFISLGWVAVLKRRVNTQTKIIRQKLGEEAALKEAAQAESEAKSRFLSTISHELRTPLAVILGYVQILGDELHHRLQPHEHDFLGIIRSSSESLLKLVDELLDRERVESGRLHLNIQTVRVDTMVQEIAGQLYPLAEKKGLSLRVIDTSEERWVHADEMRLRQVLLNLASNAIKFTEQGGVTLQIASTTLTGVEDPLQPGIAVIVQDTGVGISRDFLPRLFEPFTQEQRTYHDAPGGFGLGLALSHELIARMGGTIHAESEEGTGSIFTVILPYAAPPDESVSSRDVEATAA